MEIQLKKGLLEICILAAILNEDSYGYRIIETIRPYIRISESTLYPILRRLGESGLLEVRPVEYNGRTRKYYHITDNGQKELARQKEQWEAFSGGVDRVLGQEAFA